MTLPYGGGAGMVMLPEVWGKALDPLMTPETDLIILTPAGKRFDQPMAAQFLAICSQHLVFACADAMRELMIAYVSITKITVIAFMKFLSAITFLVGEKSQLL